MSEIKLMIGALGSLDMKTCKHCNKSKPLERFARSHTCKACYSKIQLVRMNMRRAAMRAEFERKLIELGRKI